LDSIAYLGTSGNLVGACGLTACKTADVAAKVVRSDVCDRGVHVGILTNVLVVTSVVAVDNELVEAVVGHGRRDHSGRGQESGG